MNLKEYLRINLANKFIPLVRKEQCEICGVINNNNLEVHHETQFIELLSDTLEILDLKYKDNTKDYSKNELEKINLILLGKHLNSKYITLCQNCHDDKHVLQSLFKNMRQLEKIRFYKQDVLLLNKKLSELENEKLFENKKEELVKFLSESLFNSIKIRNGYSTVKIKTVNDFFEKHNIKYKVIPKRESKRNDGNYRMRYWVIIGK